MNRKGRVLILSGVSGSGKTTWTQKQFDSLYTIVVSADNYFSKIGGYRFEALKLPQAHAECFRRFIEVCRTLHPSDGMTIVVDNTNLTTEEIAPYVLGAQAYQWDVELITFRVSSFDIPQLAKRNVHGVSLSAIERQYEKLLKRRIPPFWNITEANAFAGTFASVTK